MTRTGALFSAYILSTFIMVAVPGKFFPHYYQYWLPVLSIGAAWTLEEFQKMQADSVPDLIKMMGEIS